MADLYTREFPSDEDCYSSDYESYISEEESSSCSSEVDIDEEENPDETSHEVRPRTTTATAASRTAARTPQVSSRVRRKTRRRPKTTSADKSKLGEGIVLAPSSLSLELEDYSADLEGYDPVVLICPGCRAQVMTRVERRASGYNWMACVLCVCIVPCTWEVLKDNVHTCPTCGMDLSEHARHRRSREEGEPDVGRTKDRSMRYSYQQDLGRKVDSGGLGSKKRDLSASLRYSYTLPSPKTQSGRRRSSAPKIRVSKVSPIQQELDRLRVPRQSEQNAAGGGGRWKNPHLPGLE